MSVYAKEEIMLPRRRRLIYWLVFIVTLLFVTVAGLEIGARIFMALQGQQRYDERLAKIDQAIERTKLARAFTPSFSSNPYWGYGHAKGVSGLEYLRSTGSAYQYPLSEREFALLVDGITANNWGFWSDRDYPHNQPDAYVVGIFGGSVANFFSVMMRKELERGLSTILNRKVVVLNFSVGGAKQPQQVQILTFFGAIGQKFDLVLNIDGINEIAMSARNAEANVTTAMPFYSLIALLRQDEGAALQITEYASQATSIGRFLETIKSVVQWNMQHLGSHFVHLSVVTASIFAERRLIDMRASVDRQRRPAQDVQWATTPAFGRLFDTDEPAEQGIRVWMESARIMAKVANGIGAEYFEFVQPSQYLTQRKFTEQERAVAFDNFEVLARPYASLVRRIGELVSEGIKVFSLVDVFETEEGPIYVDGCCHVNVRGNKLIAEEIIKRFRTEMTNARSLKRE